MMKIRLKYANKYNLDLGFVFLENGKITCNDFPFSEKVIMTRKKQFKVKMLAFSLLDELMLSISEIEHENETVFLFLKIQPDNVTEETFEYIVDPNPAALFNCYVNELRKYSLEKGDMDYASMFKICSCKKENTEC